MSAAAVLACSLAVGGTSTQWQDEYLHAIANSAGYTSGACTGSLSPIEALLLEVSQVQSASLGEHEPTDVAIRTVTDILRELNLPSNVNIPDAEIDYYYGELGVEWRAGNRILRLTAFSVPGYMPRLDYGTLGTSGNPGDYRSDANATADLLATRLSWLSSTNGQTV